MQNIGFSPASVTPGGQTTVSFTIANSGTATANASTAVVRINQSTTSAAGTNLASVSVASLAAGASSAKTAAVTVPTAAGTYRVWVLADNASTSGQTGEAADNDIVLASGKLTVAAAGSPDLVVQNIGFSPASVTPGGQTTVSFTIANSGTATANASTAVVRINQSTTSAAGTNLASVSVASLAAGASSAKTAAVTVPTAAGTYRVWVIADNASTAGQVSTAVNNDIVLAAGTLIVR